MARGRILPTRRELHRQLVQERFQRLAAEDSLRCAMDELRDLRVTLGVREPCTHAMVDVRLKEDSHLSVVCAREDCRQVFESYDAWLKRGPLARLLSSAPGARP